MTMKLSAAVLVGILSVVWGKRADSAANSALLCSYNVGVMSEVGFT